MKTVPVVISLILSVVVLFGGYVIYQEQFVKKPIEEYIAALDGVQLEEIRVDKSSIYLDVAFRDADAFLESYGKMGSELQTMNRGREVHIILPASDEKMERIWQEGYFYLVEVIENQQYSQIPAVLKSWKEQYDLTGAGARMDENNVMIVLSKGDAMFYQVLPRHAGEVKANG